MFNIPFIQTPFGYVLKFFYSLFNNYGIALLLFSVAVKLLLLPAGAKSKKAMMKTSRLQPMVKKIELACGDDKERYQREVSQLYKDEGASMTGGCLWSFLPLLILFPLYNVIRAPLEYLLHIKSGSEEFAAIKTAFENAGGSTKNYYWQFTAAANIETYAKGIVDGVRNINFMFCGIDLSLEPSVKVWKMHTWKEIGGFLIPLLSGGIQYLSMFISQKMSNDVITNEAGEKDVEAAKSSAGSGKVMMLTMPLISVWIGYSFPLGLSIYWIAQGLLGILQDWLLTRRYRKIYDAEDAVKREKAAARAAEEAEKERIRAAKRAANPDGITENTSRKKQQQRDRMEREAATREYEAKKRAALGLAPEEASELLGGEANRPYARGRAYRPDRYAETDENKE